MQQETDLKKINIIKIPMDYYPFALPNLTTVPDQLPAPSHKITFQTTSRMEMKSPRTRKGATFAPPSSAIRRERPSTPSQYLYKMENHRAILMQLENNAIQLKLHLASPHVGPLRHKANSLLDTMFQLQELLHLVTKCQEQVYKRRGYLLKLNLLRALL